MQISNVSRDDVVLWIQLMKALKAAKFNGLSTDDMSALTKTLTWASALGKQIGQTFESEQNSKLEPLPAPKVTAASAIRKSSKKRR